MPQEGTLEAENEHPGGDSNKENLSSLAQASNDLISEERENDRAEEALEGAISGAPQNWIPPQGEENWQPAEKKANQHSTKQTI